MVSKIKLILVGEGRMEEKNNALQTMELGKEFLEEVQKEDIIKEYWQQFFKTGKIQDYLNYVRCFSKESHL